MASLSKKAIEEYKELYLKNFGVELLDDEASKRAINLVDLYSAVYGDNSQMIDRRKEKHS